MIRSTIGWKYRTEGEHSRGGLGRVPCPEWFDLEARVSEEKSGALKTVRTFVAQGLGCVPRTIL